MYLVNNRFFIINLKIYKFKNGNFMKIVPRSFYNRDTVEVAQDLLGKIVIRAYQNQIISGRIVETEAYRIDDPASHSYRGPTQANRAMFGPVGHAYIYFIYGNHYCLNAVARDENHEAGGVLIRALEPIEGVELMQKFRQRTDIHNLTNGPGKLAQALHITKALYGVDLTKKGELYILDAPEIIASQFCAVPRVGISKAIDVPWRFYICGNPFVSRK